MTRALGHALTLTAAAWLWFVFAVVIPAAAAGRTYYGVSIAEAAQTKHTHISVCGRVALVRAEADGDVHLRLEDARGAFVVAEIVPAIPLPRPKLGAFARIAGISRYDKQHGWPEIHPVEGISVVNGCSR